MTTEHSIFLKNDTLLKEILNEWNPNAVVLSIEGLTPDASTRRYFRIQYSLAASAKSAATKESIVAMCFSSLTSPEASGVENVSSDQAYVDLTHFFLHHKIPVPELLFDARDRAVLLIEDLGSEHLADAVLGRGSRSYSAEEIDELYCQAIDAIVGIQNISSAENCIACKRTFSEKVLLQEMYEFRDFFLSQLSLQEEQTAGVEKAIFSLATEIDRYPRRLAHRDFHSWNLLVDAQGRLRVIDFQDALLAPEGYDLIGLLNDRDTDRALGQERYLKLLEYFQKKAGLKEDFIYRYDRLLLQRDLKVVGRFSKLVRTRNLPLYQQWIPGTLRRIGQTLERVCSGPGNIEPFVILLNILAENIDEVKSGRSAPLRLGKK